MLPHPANPELASEKPTGNSLNDKNRQIYFTEIMDNDSLPPQFTRSPLSMGERDEIASALIERYGIYVGNYLIEAVDRAMDDHDHAKLADLLAISDAMTKMLGGQVVLQPNFPKDYNRPH